MASMTDWRTPSIFYVEHGSRIRDDLRQNLTEMQSMFDKAGNDAQGAIDQLRCGLGLRHPGEPQ